MIVLSLFSGPNGLEVCVCGERRKETFTKIKAFMETYFYNVILNM